MRGAGSATQRGQVGRGVSGGARELQAERERTGLQLGFGAGASERVGPR